MTASARPPAQGRFFGVSPYRPLREVQIKEDRRSGSMIRETIAAFAALIFASDAFADDLAGQASVIDGDTLEIHGTRIRLWGIDAPESTQLCRGEDSLQYRCCGCRTWSLISSAPPAASAARRCGRIFRRPAWVPVNLCDPTRQQAVHDAAANGSRTRSRHSGAARGRLCASRTTGSRRRLACDDNACAADHPTCAFRGAQDRAS